MVEKEVIELSNCNFAKNESLSLLCAMLEILVTSAAWGRSCLLARLLEGGGGEGHQGDEVTNKASKVLAPLHDETK